MIKTCKVRFYSLGIDWIMISGLYMTCAKKEGVKHKRNGASNASEVSLCVCVLKLMGTINHTEN